MPPQQFERLLEFIDDGLRFRAHEGKVLVIEKLNRAQELGDATVARKPDQEAASRRGREWQNMDMTRAA